MTAEQLFSYIDHTLLRPTASWEEVETLCQEAIRYKTASVCVPPYYVKPIFTTFGSDVNICTVIGFPLGYNTAETKLREVREAIQNGAGELDVVINQAMVKNGRMDLVTEEIARLKGAAGTRVVKVIVETCNMTMEEKIALCRCVTEGGGDFIKTSTGFGEKGATLEDIRLFADHIGPRVKMKASGGIRTLEALEMFVEAGCARIGTSCGVALLAKD